MVAHADFVAAFESAFDGQVFLVWRLGNDLRIYHLRYFPS